MNKIFLAVLLQLLTSVVVAQQPQPIQLYKPITGNSLIAAKNYYLLTLLQTDNPARQLIVKDSILTALIQHKLKQLSISLTDCNNELMCFTEHLKFSDDEIKLVSDRLRRLYSGNNALGRLVQQHLFPSGNYILFQQLSPVEMLVKAWEQDANGINFVIGVYAEGKKAHYPNIDSIAFNTKAAGFSRLLYSLDYLVINECAGKNIFFLPSPTAAVRLLEMNEREQAADFEPMVSGENKLAYERVKTIPWNNYTYSVIMIPGAGPEEPAVALSAESMLRCRLAALQYRKGLAPFIVTSGGKVHPYKTKYCEATEMKKYLIEKLQVPPSAIIIDPHARHTTTNMRNTARLIYRYGMPFSKPAITCTTRGQSSMIETTLIARCIKELHAAPYKNGMRLSETVIEFYPMPEALHINPEEPMDP